MPRITVTIERVGVEAMLSICKDGINVESIKIDNVQFSTATVGEISEVKIEGETKDAAVQD